MSFQVPCSSLQPWQPVRSSPDVVECSWLSLGQDTQDYYKRMIRLGLVDVSGNGVFKTYWRRDKADVEFKKAYFGHHIKTPLPPSLARASSETQSYRLWIACGAPTVEVSVAFMSEALKQGDLLVNLRKPSEISLKQKVLYERVLQAAADKGVDYYHYQDWSDQTAIPVEELHKLVGNIRKIEREKSIQRIWIHCFAGVGRTGTAIAATHLAETIEEAEAEPILENPRLWVINQVQKSVLSIRKQRSSACVATIEQYKLLCEYGDFLVRNRLFPRLESSSKEQTKNPWDSSDDEEMTGISWPAKSASTNKEQTKNPWDSSDDEGMTGISSPAKSASTESDVLTQMA